MSERNRNPNRPVVVHLTRAGFGTEPGWRFHNMSACGLHYRNSDVLRTTDPEKTTCRSCQHSAYFKNHV